jgi:hypothetical protein
LNGHAAQANSRSFVVISRSAKGKKKPRVGTGSERINSSLARKILPRTRSQDKLPGSPAFQRLLAGDQARAQDFFSTQAAFRARWEKIKREIVAIEGVNDNLIRLKNAGAVCDTILHLIAIEVTRGSALRDMRAAKDRTKRAAKHLRQKADELEQLYRDETSYPEMWGVALQKIRSGKIVPVARRLPRRLLSEMRACADELHGFAGQFGQILKRYSPEYKREPTRLLLAYTHKAAGGVHRHLPSIAAILTDAYEKYGIKKTATAEGLAKIFKRHVKFVDKTPT